MGQSGISDRHVSASHTREAERTIGLKQTTVRLPDRTKEGSRGKGFNQARAGPDHSRAVGAGEQETAGVNATWGGAGPNCAWFAETSPNESPRRHIVDEDDARGRRSHYTTTPV